MIYYKIVFVNGNMFLSSGHIHLQRDHLPPINQPNGNPHATNDVSMNTTSSGQSSPSLQRITPRSVASPAVPIANGLANGSPTGPGRPSPSAVQVEGHQRNSSSTSTSSSSTTSGGATTNNGNNLDFFHGFVVAVHRKMVLKCINSHPSLNHSGFL